MLVVRFFELNAIDVPSSKAIIAIPGLIEIMDEGVTIMRLKV